jgi:hypothetical protein
MGKINPGYDYNAPVEDGPHPRISEPWSATAAGSAAMHNSMWSEMNPPTPAVPPTPAASKGDAAATLVPGQETEPDLSMREYNDRLLELRIKRLEQEISRTGGGPHVGSVEEHNKKADQWKKLHPGR